MRLLARKAYYFPIDLWQELRGQKQKFVPPKGDVYTGSGDFVKQGIHQVELLKYYVDLRSDHHVLDIGSGIGRTAIPLTEYVNNSGAYEGFDVVEKGVRWCKKTIQKEFPNFNFTYIPLHNDLYNSTTQQASEFIFPYKEAQFDVIFLFSVFTHMSLEEVQQYLSEIHRVLKPNGQCLATFFIYNKQDEDSIATRKEFAFPILKNGYRLMDEKVTSANIAFEEQTILDLFSNAGLQRVKQIDGFWNPKVDKQIHNDFQDILVLKKIVT